MFDYYLIVTSEDGTFRVLHDTKQELSRYQPLEKETTTLVRRVRKQ